MDGTVAGGEGWRGEGRGVEGVRREGIQGKLNQRKET